MIPIKDLRKLIKYEERLGVNNQQNDYYESLFRRTTASYRAKYDREKDKKTPPKRSFNIEPSCSRRAAADNRKVLRERNSGEMSTSSFDVLSSVHSSKSSDEKKVDESKTDRRSIKSLAEKMLTQVLCEKYSQEFVEKDTINKSPIKTMIEQILKEKLNSLHHPLRHNRNLSFCEPGSLRSIIEDIVIQVVEEKFRNIQNENNQSNTDDINNLNQILKQKLTISNNQDNVLSREPVTHYNKSRPLDSQSLVQELLSSEKVENKKLQNKNCKQSKADKENSKTSPKVCGIKRLRRSPRKKPEWRDPSLHDQILDKPVKAARSRSPVVPSSAHSGRSSSVLIRRAKSQRRKPISDPVALYQYYKTEWEHFRHQIPGETSHDRLRWHVRQRLLDPE